MVYIPNLTWTVADADQVQSMARAGYSASHIATIIGRTEEGIRKFCADNGIFVRSKTVVAK